MADLSMISTYRGLWSLCALNKHGKMQAVYYATCCVYGRAPLWVIWDARTTPARFVGFAGSRDEISKLHAGYSWRRVMAKWSLANAEDTRAEVRRQRISLEYDRPLPGEKPRALEARKAMFAALEEVPPI